MTSTKQADNLLEKKSEKHNFFFFFGVFLAFSCALVFKDCRLSIEYVRNITWERKAFLPTSTSIYREEIRDIVGQSGTESDDDGDCEAVVERCCSFWFFGGVDGFDYGLFHEKVAFFCIVVLW